MNYFESAKELLAKWKAQEAEPCGNLTPRAKQIIALAYKEAERLNHKPIAPAVGLVAQNHKPRQGRQIKPFVCFLPPLPGLELFWMIPPTVSPWAIIVRRSATSKTTLPNHCTFRSCKTFRKVS
jgi:hypothetical protein